MSNGVTSYESMSGATERTGFQSCPRRTMTPAMAELLDSPKTPAVPMTYFRLSDRGSSSRKCVREREGEVSHDNH